MLTAVLAGFAIGFVAGFVVCGLIEAMRYERSRERLEKLKKDFGQ